jgi:hypothetical protein
MKQGRDKSSIMENHNEFSPGTFLVWSAWVFDLHAIFFQELWKRPSKRFEGRDVHDGHVDQDDVESFAILGPAFNWRGGQAP